MKIPKFLRSLKIASIIILIISILAYLIINPYAINARDSYGKNEDVRQQWQKEFDKVTMDYYELMLKEGFMNIPDLTVEGEKTIWETKMYPRIRELYNYKLYVNGKEYSKDGKSLQTSGSIVTIEIEEFFTEESEKLVPAKILSDYSYFRSLGTGILSKTDEEISIHMKKIFNVSEFENEKTNKPTISKTMTANENERFTRFTFTYDFKDFSSGNSVELSFKQDSNKQDLLSKELGIFGFLEIRLV